MAKSTISDDPVRGQDKFMLRLPEGMRDILKAQADENNRSMNAEIVAILEEYPKLQILRPRVAYLTSENGRAEKAIEALREELAEQKKISRALQHLLNEQSEKARQEQETLSIIEKQFNELKEQSDYLERLKVELIDLIKEKDEIRLESKELIQQQSELIDRLMKSEKDNSRLLLIVRRELKKVAAGDEEALKQLLASFRLLSDAGEQD